VKYLTTEALTRDVKTVEVMIDGYTARIKELSRSRRMAYDDWLRPKGELDKKREESRDLKLCVLCLVDEAGELLMDFDDEAYEAFVESLQDKAAGPWAELALEVLRVNGYIKDEDEDEPDLLGE
jgi:hypothetical protein